MTVADIWQAASVGLLAALVPAGIVCFRGSVADRLAGLEFASIIITLELVALCEAFSRPAFYDLPLTLALLSFGGGLVFARFVQRWL